MQCIVAKEQHIPRKAKPYGIARDIIDIFLWCFPTYAHNVSKAFHNAAEIWDGVFMLP